MTDYISRADAIDAVAEEWLSEASAESPYVNVNDIDRYRELAEDLFADIPSAELPKGDLISRQWLLEVYGDYIGDNGEPKYYVPLEVVRQNIKDAPSADAVPQLRQTDTLIIADALRYLAKDTERHLADRTRADALRQKFLKYGASMCKGGDDE